MPTKREIAARLTRGELKKVVDYNDIDVADRRVQVSHERPDVRRWKRSGPE